MTDDATPSHLSRITTIWSLVDRAHEGESRQISDAQREIIDRYSGAAHRFLFAVLRNAEAADEVFQEFALKVVKGGYRNATPERGRFRDYVKRSLRHLVTDYYRSNNKKDPVQEAAKISAVGEIDGGEVDDVFDAEETFVGNMREELLERCWQSLKLIETTTGPELYSVLKYRAEHHDANSSDMARELTARLDRQRPFSAAGIRKNLQLAREKFAEILLYEVSQMLGSDSLDDLETELIDLGLQQYCASALQSRRSSRGNSESAG